MGWGTFLWITLILAGVAMVLGSYLPISPSITLEKAFAIRPTEQLSPSDAISLEQIQVKGNSVTLTDISRPILAQLTNTNSMDPTFDSEAILLETPVVDVTQIQPGDIVSYVTPLSSGVIVHRVVEIGEDDKGWYARFKGDNLNTEDPQVVRANQIQRKVLAIFY